MVAVVMVRSISFFLLFWAVMPETRTLRRQRHDLWRKKNYSKVE